MDVDKKHLIKKVLWILIVSIIYYSLLLFIGSDLILLFIKIIIIILLAGVSGRLKIFYDSRFFVVLLYMICIELLSILLPSIIHYFSIINMYEYLNNMILLCSYILSITILFAVDYSKKAKKVGVVVIWMLLVVFISGIIIKLSSGGDSYVLWFFVSQLVFVFFAILAIFLGIFEEKNIINNIGYMFLFNTLYYPLYYGLQMVVLEQGLIFLHYVALFSIVFLVDKYRKSLVNVRVIILLVRCLWIFFLSILDIKA